MRKAWGIEMTKHTPQAMREKFESWWRASKYCQLITPSVRLEQIAWDGYQAALRDLDDAAEASQVCVPEGWMWFSADLSCLCSSRNPNPRAIVGLVRDHAGQAWWHSLSEDEKDAAELYIYAEAPSFDKAFRLACDLTKRAIAASSPKVNT
jgi:hypothetical protein